ncbi:MAG: helix-turn-helix transcriptional regulator [Halioglobus sp.]|nr:helix-turn-helix transcriptional regulator [Halioglobus sp.]
MKPSSRIDRDFSHLIELIYRGALEQQPWQSALPALREALDAQVVSLVLRPPTADDQGVILNSVRPDPSRDINDASLADPNDWEASAYREQFFSLDPFVNLPPDKVIALEDILPDKELLNSDYYLYYLKPIDLFRILGVDTVEPGGMLARLRFSRRASEARFRTRERALLDLLTPHLRLSIEIYAKLNRMTSERDLYAGAVNQLSVATIILDERGRLLTTNAVGQALLDQGEGLSLREGRLHIEGRDINKELQQALATIIRAQLQGETSLVRALRVPRSAGRSDLGLVIRPVPASQWSEGQSSPSAAVFISDPDLQESTSGQILGELFDLTPAEANLATLLARGLSLAQVSSAQTISQHTARAQLKSIFAKTGVSRQAELVRLVLKSVASLG